MYGQFPRTGASPHPLGGSGLQIQRAQRRQRQTQTVRLPGPRLILRPDLASIAEVATGVQARIGIQDLPPWTPSWHAHPVLIPGHRRAVAHDDNVTSTPTASEKSEDAIFVVVRLEPLEPGPVEVHLVERGILAICPMQ